jgi:hypothetical protein
MKPFEFVAIFIFIIFGMAISEVIVSMANLLKHYDQVTFYLPLCLWMAAGRLLTINYFFSIYRLQKIKACGIRNFGILITSTVLFVTTTYLVVPGDFNEQSLNLETCFRHNSFFIYLTVIALMTSLVLEAYFIYRSKKTMACVSPGIGISVLLIGSIFNNRFSDYFTSLSMLALQEIVTIRSPKIIADREF